MARDTLDGRAAEIVRAPNHAVLAIPRGDGSVQSLVVWADLEDGRVTLNSAEGRAWPANLRRAGRATVTLFADGDPQEWVSVEGRVEEVTHEGADEHIDALAKKYTGADRYPFRSEDEQRVRFVLAPERVVHTNMRG